MDDEDQVEKDTYERDYVDGRTQAVKEFLIKLDELGEDSVYATVGTTGPTTFSDTITKI